MPSDAHYISVAGKHGCRPGLARVIITAARQHGLDISLLFALVQHESGFRKVFGHDPTIFIGAGDVTKAKYLAYKHARQHSGNKLMQGVGECQLTWWATQDEADAIGGCWTAKANVTIAARTLASNIKTHGKRAGVRAYNGSGPAAEEYATQVLAAADTWHKYLQ